MMAVYGRGPARCQALHYAPEVHLTLNTTSGRTTTTHFTYKETVGPEELRQVPQATQQGLNLAIASGACALSQDLLSVDQIETQGGCAWHVTICYP